LIYYVIIAAIVAADQVVKHMIASGMTPGESVPVIDGILNISYIRNTGAAFSAFSSHTWMLIVITSVLMAVGLVYVTRHRKDRNRMLMTALAVIIGGGAGNLIDRIVNGYVVDFIQVGAWPVFNIADISVCTGCGLLCIYIIFIDGRKHGRR